MGGWIQYLRRLCAGFRRMVFFYSLLRERSCLEVCALLTNEVNALMNRVAIGLIVAALLLCGGIARAEVVDGIVASIGPEVILQSDLLQELAPNLSELRRSAKSQEEFNREFEKLMQTALDQAIDNKILLREAQLAGLQIKDMAVEERITDIRKRFGTSDEFQRELEKSGETISDFRERIRKQILAISYGMQKRRQFEREVEVSETDLKKFFDENPAKFSHGERVRASRIFLAASNADERTKALARMEDLKKQIEGGADFAELAKKNSEGPEAENGGMMGWVARNDLVKELEDVVFALPEGAISKPLETEFGVVLFKSEKRDVAGSQTFENARKDIEPMVRTQGGNEKYKKWISELRKRSRVRIFSLAGEK